MKYIRIRKVGFRNYQDGFEFIKYLRCDNFFMEFTESKDELSINFNLEDLKEVGLEKKMSINEYQLFNKNWKQFLLNQEYFFDLADFSRK
jgi:hypothetical protein